MRNYAANIFSSFALFSSIRKAFSTRPMLIMIINPGGNLISSFNCGVILSLYVSCVFVCDGFLASLRLLEPNTLSLTFTLIVQACIFRTVSVFICCTFDENSYWSAAKCNFNALD